LKAFIGRRIVLGLCNQKGEHLGNLGIGELALIALIVIVIFGARRLPQIGEGFGRAIRNFKRGLRGDEEIDVTPAPPKQMSANTGSEPLPKVDERPKVTHED